MKPREALDYIRSLPVIETELDEENKVDEAIQALEEAVYQKEKMTGQRHKAVGFIREEMETHEKLAEIAEHHAQFSVAGEHKAHARRFRNILDEIR